ncbi:hypothetical protein ACE15N_21740 (plasmid) [Xanthomonas campestris pv. passiflorae]
MSKEPQPLNAEKLLALLTSVDRSLSHLSAVARLPHVYSEGAVKGLVEQYGKLAPRNARPLKSGRRRWPSWGSSRRNTR